MFVYGTPWSDRPSPLREQWMDLDSHRPWRNLSFAVIAAAVLAVGFWLSSTRPLPPAAPVQRSDKLYVEPMPPPSVVQVRTIPIVPPSPPPVADDPVPAAPRRERAVQKSDDICTRHAMHKVTTRGGRSWRCRK